MSLARLRKGDAVVVMSGKDKGKKGKILRLDLDADKVVVEGVNLIKRHMRPTPKIRKAASSRRKRRSSRAR